MNQASQALPKAGLEAIQVAIRQLLPDLTAAEWEHFRSGLALLTLPRRAIFLAAGRVHHQLGFVVSGLVREYYFNEQNQEVTTAFFREGEYATDYAALLARQPSRYSLQCLEPTVLLTLSYDYVQAGYRQYPGLERYGRLVAEEVVKLMKGRIESFLFQSAEQRYVAFVQHRPNLFRRVSLAHLASYLGMERTSLSRIRRKLVSR